MKQFFKKLVLNSVVLFVAGVLTLVALEGIFRLSRPNDVPLKAVSQQDRQYLFNPQTSFQNTSSIPGEFDVTVRINAFGYRGDDFQREKQSDMTRIFLVGDSFTFGVGAEDDETIPFLVQQKLRAQGYAVEVINAGVGHSSPITHYMNLRDLHLRYNPDVVIFLFDYTDIADDWYAGKHAVYNERGDIVDVDQTIVYGKRNWWNIFVRRSALGKYINNKCVRTFKKIRTLGLKQYVLAKIQGKRAKAEIAAASKTKDIDPVSFDNMLFLRGEEYTQYIEHHWKRTERYLAKIHALLANNNIPMVFVTYPYGIFVGGDQWGKGRVYWGFEEGKVYDSQYQRSLMRAFCHRHDIPFIDAEEVMITHASEQLYFDYDGHMTPVGNAVVAGVIVSNDSFLNLINNQVADA